MLFIKKLKPAGIISLVSKYIDIPVDDIIGHVRRREFVEARHICMYILKKNNKKLDLRVIGSAFGNRDHSTVVYGIQKTKDLMYSDRHHRVKVLEIEAYISRVQATPIR